jgi:uncharacterized protein (TIGR02246 family)
LRRTERISSLRNTLPFALIAAVAACATGETTPEPSPRNAADEIVAMLQASAQAWNRGDLDAFLADYDENATFVGAAGMIHGRDEIRRRYVQGYWSEGTAPDRLAFQDIDVRVTGPRSATAVGRYILRDRDTNERTGTGTFTLLLARYNDGWRILHDHSSADGGD